MRYVIIWHFYLHNDIFIRTIHNIMYYEFIFSIRFHTYMCSVFMSFCVISNNCYIHLIARLNYKAETKFGENRSRRRVIQAHNNPLFQLSYTSVIKWPFVSSAKRIMRIGWSTGCLFIFNSPGTSRGSYECRS